MIAFIVVALILTLVVADVYVFGLKNRLRSRKYKSGTGWCVWRWTDVESEYILRLHVFKTPWFALCLHWINKPDKEPWLHDHPVSFLSVILRGAYAELRQKPGEFKPTAILHRWFNFVRADKNDKHRIVYAEPGTLTLCFMGPKTREWGFRMPGDWIGWKDYYKHLKDGLDMRWEEGVPYAVSYLGEMDTTVYLDETATTKTGDDAWFWCDETWWISGPYPTREEALNAQWRYTVEELGL